MIMAIIIVLSVGAGLWFLLYMFIRLLDSYADIEQYIDYKNNRYNSQFVRELWKKTPQLKQKYYDQERCIWVSVRALIALPLQQIPRHHEKSVAEYEWAKQHNENLRKSYTNGDVPEYMLQPMP